jgi:tRNA(Arg) A34 adenosine deaminase TadA
MLLARITTTQHLRRSIYKDRHFLEPANIFRRLTTINQLQHDNQTYDSTTTFTTNHTFQPPLTIEMKTDNYLTLCLEQATKSPLHYRHGCIVVRGGKVIGRGHNDYRPGFDGGALKHGRVASSALNGPALADMKAKLKQRKANKLSPKEKEAAFQKLSNGGGPQANTPLSMHSEMMAIHSALSTSSTMACSTFSREKPCFKLSASDKKKERLRRDVLRSYVESICASAGTITACGGGKDQVQECGFEDPASRRGLRETGHGRRVSRSEGYRETPESVREEEWETSRVRTVRSGWETATTARFPGATGSAICV